MCQLHTATCSSVSAENEQEERVLTACSSCRGNSMTWENGGGDSFPPRKPGPIENRKVRVKRIREREQLLPSPPSHHRHICISPRYHCSWNAWCRQLTKLLFRSSFVNLLGGHLGIFQTLDSAFTLYTLGSPGKSEEPQRGARKKCVVSSGNFCFMWKLR